MYKTQTIYSIVRRLTGSIKPYGATQVDAEREQNLTERVNLTKDLISDLMKTAQFNISPEDSMRSLGTRATDELISINKWIEEILEERKTP